MTTTGHTTRRQSRRATTATYRKLASQIATTAPTTTLVATPDRQRRREGWRVLRQLRANVATLNASIVAAARHDARVTVRVARIADGGADGADGEALDAHALRASLPASLPASLSNAFAGSDVLTGLACADVWGDPHVGALSINADALDALRWADIRLDDALLGVRLTRPGNRERWTEDEQAKALATLAAAIEQARDATQRAQALSYDVATVARLLGIVRGALSAQCCPA